MNQALLVQTDTFIPITQFAEPLSDNPRYIVRRAFEKAKSEAGDRYKECKSVTQHRDSISVTLKVGRTLQEFNYKIKDIQVPRQVGVRRSIHEIPTLRGMGFFRELIDAAEFQADEIGAFVGDHVIEYPNRYEVELTDGSTITVML
ncbi:hypothetical protein SP15_239 [Bacillus phage SP-15]|uniref:Uncharacterized protein n=1 Tax=Bacillus phage SP-15 TaxID=1792032 RepID=A0A127AWS6_9CAUD|nr:hypothetical protein SP15_239 [Bacillus phage SP-15]AMM45042.1 hypothetical protein SP15_239 [Bacillus phage SP-15]